jgi:hypothetical protein
MALVRLRSSTRGRNAVKAPLPNSAFAFASKEPIDGDAPQTQSAWRARFEIFFLTKLIA